MVPGVTSLVEKQDGQEVVESIDDLPLAEQRETQAAVLRTTVKTLFIQIPPAVQTQIDDDAAAAIKDIFSKFLEDLVSSAREKASKKGGLSAPLIEKSHIYEAKEAVLRKEIAVDDTLSRKSLRWLDHICWAAVGGIAERCLVEGKLETPAVLTLIVVFILLIFLSRTFSPE